MNIHCRYDQLTDPKSLQDHPLNRNKHPKDQIERLAKIYKYQGIRHPIIVSKLSGCIVAGHGRKQAAIKAQLENVPVVYQEFESNEQEYAFIQSDNAIAIWADLDLSGINADIPSLGPDFDIDLLGIRGFTIDVADKGLIDEDQVPEETEPRTKPGDLYILGNHRLLCGDATVFANCDRLLGGEKPDSVFTDPPYGISVQMNQDGTKCKEKIMGDDSTTAAVDAFNLCSTLNVPMIFWGANHYAGDAKLPNAKCWLAWNKQEKNNHIDQADCELAWTNLDSPARQFHHLWAGFRRDSEKGETRVHPTQKPVALIEEIFDHFKKHMGTNILDLFGGSGSTMIACQKLNLRCFMMELDPRYCDAIIARWESFSGQKAQLC